MAELVDAPVLGTGIVMVWGFESLHPHQISEIGRETRGPGVFSRHTKLCARLNRYQFAPMAEPVDAADSKSASERSGGSSPSRGTKYQIEIVASLIKIISDLYTIPSRTWNEYTRSAPSITLPVNTGSSNE